MAMDGYFCSREEGIQHSLAAVLGTGAKVEGLTQARVIFRLLKQFGIKFLIEFHSLELAPNHLIYYTYVRLDDLHDLGTYVFFNIVWNRDSMTTIFAEFYCCIDCLEE